MVAHSACARAQLKTNSNGVVLPVVNHNGSRELGTAENPDPPRVMQYSQAGVGPDKGVRGPVRKLLMSAMRICTQIKTFQDMLGVCLELF